MERIASLIEQLQQAVLNNASVTQLLLLTNMLHAELEQKQQNNNPSLSTQKVSVVFPAARRDRKSTRLNSSHSTLSRMPSSA